MSAGISQILNKFKVVFKCDYMPNLEESIFLLESLKPPKRHIKDKETARESDIMFIFKFCEAYLIVISGIHELNRSEPFNLNSAISLQNVHFSPASTFHNADKVAGPWIFSVIYEPETSSFILGLEEMLIVLSSWA